MKLKVYAIAVSVLLITLIAVIITLFVDNYSLNEDNKFLEFNLNRLEDLLYNTNDALNHVLSVQRLIYNEDIEYMVNNYTTDVKINSTPRFFNDSTYHYFSFDTNARVIADLNFYEYNGIIITTNKDFTKFKTTLVATRDSNSVTTYNKLFALSCPLKSIVRFVPYDK